MCKCRECAEEAFWIGCIPLVNMVFAQDDFINNVKNIRSIVCITITKFEQGIISNEDACNKPRNKLVVYR